MKWFDTTKYLPAHGLRVLTSDLDVVYFDGECWYNYHTEMIQDEPEFWMNIPNLPYE